MAFPPWAIYAAVTNLEGQHRFSLSLTHNDDERNILPLSGELTSRTVNDVIEIAPTIVGLPFPKPGRYTLTFQVDEFPIGARLLLVDRQEVAE
jgi:hypothetical protein